MTELLHATEPCTGEWFFQRRGQSICWCCTGCGMRYHHTPGVMRMALAENALGERLADLARAGRWLRTQEP